MRVYNERKRRLTATSAADAAAASVVVGIGIDTTAIRARGIIGGSSSGIDEATGGQTSRHR